MKIYYCYRIITEIYNIVLCINAYKIQVNLPINVY